jgi:predicted MPP superfamily phosphohydrolase
MSKKRKAIGIIAIILALIALVHIIHALTLDRTIQYVDVAFHSERIPVEMDGYRIAFVTDTHMISDASLQDVVSRLNDWQADLLLLGGDFGRRDGDPHRTLEALAQIETTDGIFGVEGNHDRFWELFAAMEANNMTPLSNSGVRIRDNFYLAGVEDLWNRNPNIAQAVSGVEPDDFVILLSHNPDVSMRQDTSNIDLILSGHTHGGQITFFGILAPALWPRHITHYGQRFMSGWAESRDGTPVFVSNGTGEYMPRVFARPQVILITLYAEG